MKRLFCIDPMAILVSYQAVPLTFYSKIAPMFQSKEKNKFTKRIKEVNNFMWFK